MPKDASSLATAPLPVTSTSGGVSVAQVVTTSGAQVVSQQTTSPGMIFLNANGQQLTSPTRVVQIGSDQIQNGQGKYVVVQQQQPTTRVIGKLKLTTSVSHLHLCVFLIDSEI